MGNVLKRVGKLYSHMIRKNIGIFLFIGLMSVLFMENGWIPNEGLYRISRIAYFYLVPIVLAYEAGQTMKSQEGATAAALATLGLLVADIQIGILGAILIAPLVVTVVKYGWAHIQDHIRQGMELLVRNLFGLFGDSCG